MFSDCLRAELASRGIGVSTICPGIVATNIVSTKMRRYGPDKVAKQIVKAVKMGKSVVPVTPEAHLQYRFSRFAPALGRLAAAKASLG
jgi:short-subunit dehydrogenase